MATEDGLILFSAVQCLLLALFSLHKYGNSEGDVFGQRVDEGLPVVEG